MKTLKLSGDKPRCWWCGCVISGDVQRLTFNMRGEQYETTVCSLQHAGEVVKAYEQVNRRMPLFGIGMFGGLLLFVTSNYVRWSSVFLLAGIACFGVTLFFCPFTTPQTVEMIGLKRSFRIGRVGGVMFLIGAVVLFVVFSAARTAR